MKSALYKNGEFVREVDVRDSQCIIGLRKHSSSDELRLDEYKRKNFPYAVETDPLGRVIFEYQPPIAEE